MCISAPGLFTSSTIAPPTKIKQYTYMTWWGPISYWVIGGLYNILPSETHSEAYKQLWHSLSSSDIKEQLSLLKRCPLYCLWLGSVLVPWMRPSSGFHSAWHHARRDSGGSHPIVIWYVWLRRNSEHYTCDTHWTTLVTMSYNLCNNKKGWFEPNPPRCHAQPRQHIWQHLLWYS